MLKEFNDPYEDEKQWLTEDSACQNLEDEKDPATGWPRFKKINKKINKKN